MEVFFERCDLLAVLIDFKRGDPADRYLDEAVDLGIRDYALRQLGQVPGYLRTRGVETKEYSPETRGLFELLPTKNEPATLRPALVAGDTLILAGRATVPEAGGTRP